MDFSDKPWGEIKPGDYSGAEEYCSACLIDQNPAGKDKVMGACKLPVREPRSMGGAVNLNALGAVASVLAGGRGGVTASPAEKRSAAQQLVKLYAQAKRDIPASIRALAGM